MIAGYLTAERDLGRIAPDRDPDLLAFTLIGTAHLLYAGKEGDRPADGAVEEIVTTIVGDAVR